MRISVALDGSKRRDIQLFKGDEVTLELAVYAEDGDLSPIAPTDVRFVDVDGFAYGTPFTVADSTASRSWYRLVGEVDGVTTTLAFGYLLVEGACGWPQCCPCDGYWVSP